MCEHFAYCVFENWGGAQTNFGSLGIKRTFGSFCVSGKLSSSIQFPHDVCVKMLQ